MKSSIWLSCPPDFDILPLPFSSTHTFTLFLPHSQPQPPPSHSSLATFSAHCSTLCSMWRNKQVTMTLRNYDSKLLSQWLKLWAGTSPPHLRSRTFSLPSTGRRQRKMGHFLDIQMLLNFPESLYPKHVRDSVLNETFYLWKLSLCKWLIKESGWDPC